MADHKRNDGILFHWKSLLACLVVSICQFQFGLDSTLIGGFQAMPGFLEVIRSTPHSEEKMLIWEGLITKVIGRTTALWIGCVLCLVGDVIMMSTTNIGALYFGRFIMGVSNALFSIFGLLYVQECAPAKYRGTMVGVSTYWITFGALIGNIIDNFTVSLDGRKSYIIPLGVILIMPGIIAIGLLFIPESPRWLLQRNKPEKAEAALKRLRHYQEAIDEELAYMAVGINTEAEFSRNARFVDLWRDPIERRRALLVIGALCIQPASGATYIISECKHEDSATLQLIILVYSTYFFEMAGIGTPFGDTCIMAGIGSFVLILNSMIITKYGRRRMFLTWGMTFCGLSQLIMAAVYTAHPNTNLTGKVTSLIRVYHWQSLLAARLSISRFTMGPYRPTLTFAAESSHLNTFALIPSVLRHRYLMSLDGSLHSLHRTSLIQTLSTGVTASAYISQEAVLKLHRSQIRIHMGRKLFHRCTMGLVVSTRELPARSFRKYECLISATSTAMTNESKVVDVTTKEVDPSLTTKRTTSGNSMEEKV
ncbi:general alpha-glucoside permease protein [Rutstroemia sp. NJR-2017a BBW]|nr:general alpha-glucoside permease protein [Rutstroemia sp. NJR-2017a BBW]